MHGDLHRMRVCVEGDAGVPRCHMSEECVLYYSPMSEERVLYYSHMSEERVLYYCQAA